MAGRSKQKSLEQWKEVARKVLYNTMDEAMRRQGVDLEKVKGMKRGDSVFLSKAVLAWDPIHITLEDAYGGKLTCSYDISGTLVGLSREFLRVEGFPASEIEQFAKSQNISRD